MRKHRTDPKEPVQHKTQESLILDEHGNPLYGHADLEKRKKLVYAVYETEFYNEYGDRFVMGEEEGKIPYFLQRTKFPRRLNISHEEYETIYNALPEIEKLWKAIKALPKPVYANDLGQWKEAALECYDAPSDWKYVTRKMLTPRNLWKNTRQGHEKDVFRGRLLQQILANRCPDHPERGYETLEQIAKEFETDRK